MTYLGYVQLIVNLNIVSQFASDDISIEKFKNIFNGIIKKKLTMQWKKMPF